MPAALAERGFTVLKDQRTALTVRGERAGHRRHPLLDENARATLPTCSRAPAARPSCSRTTRGGCSEAAALDVQLVLSGHTHGGQVIVPGVGAIAGRKFPVLAGYAARENTSLFVSRGVGTVYVPDPHQLPAGRAVLTLQARRPSRSES